MITVENKWKEFSSHTYPGTDPQSEQMRQLRACWFSAYFCCLNTIQEISIGVTDDEAVERLEGLMNESAKGIKAYVTEEIQRQKL